MADYARMQTSPYSGTFHGALKHYYDPAFKTMLRELFAWYDWLKSEKRIDRNPNIVGDKIVFGTNVKRSSGVGARGELDTLPTTDKAEVAQGEIDYLTGYKGRIAVSYEVMKQGKKGKGAFVDIVQNEIQSMIAGIKEHGSSHAWGSGNGFVARAPDHTGGGTSLTLSSTETSAACYPGTRWLHEGQYYIPVTSGTPLNYTADATWTAYTEVTAINSYTGATISPARTATSTNLLLISAETATNGSATIGTANSFVGPMGFGSMCDDGTFHSSYCNLSESTYPKWKASVLANGGTARSLTMKLFYQAFFKVGNKSGQMKPGLVGWMNHDVYLELVDLLEHFVEFKPRELAAGFQEIDVMIKGTTVKLRLDRYCPGYIFLIDPKEVHLYETIPIEMGEEDGSEWIPLADKDGYEARVRWNWQLATTARNRHGIIMDLTHTAGATL